MDKRPRAGTVVLVRQVGLSGYAFRRPCFALVMHSNGAQNQVDIEIIQMDRHDYRSMRPNYDLDTRGDMTGFIAPHKHLEPGGDEGAAALARYDGEPMIGLNELTLGSRFTTRKLWARFVKATLLLAVMGPDNWTIGMSGTQLSVIDPSDWPDEICVRVARLHLSN